MYDKFKDFSNLLDQIDSHCFTGDTLYSVNARNELAEYLGRWERSIKTHEDIEREILEGEQLELNLNDTSSIKAVEVASEAQRKLNARIQGAINQGLSDAYIEAICQGEYSEFGIEHIANTLRTLRGVSD
jgi:hypothetical protein